MTTYSQFGRPDDRAAEFCRGLSVIELRRAPGERSKGLLKAGDRVLRCAIGRAGIRSIKLEADGATPLARVRFLSLRLRGRRIAAAGSPLPARRLRENDGWCDAPADANYNRPVRLPFKSSHERMWRDDRLYDAVVVLGWNMVPRIRNRGSAIFMHIARAGYLPTEGCVALSPRDMEWLLRHVSRETVLRIVG